MMQNSVAFGSHVRCSVIQRWTVSQMNDDKGSVLEPGCKNRMVHFKAQRCTRRPKLAFVFYGRPWFLLLSFYLFSSPNLSRPRLDVYHTSTHDVALVWIWDAGLKCAARGSLEMQDAKKSPFRHHRTTLSGSIFATKACIDNREKTS